MTSLVGKVESFFHEISHDLSTIAASLAEIAEDFAKECHTPCFVSGTSIRTGQGDVAVENLKIGDMVVTASGAHRPVRWIGHRTIDCMAHPEPKWTLPIRISAGAFGAGKPDRDLYVSPGHAICVNVVDEVLLPAYTMINGSTVSQIEARSVTYWHVELDTHDILVANGMPAESYLDVGNRAFFLESQTVALDGRPDAKREVTVGTCRPLIEDGAIVSVVRDRMRHRALAMNWTLADDPLAGLHVVADGMKIAPDVVGRAARFIVPSAAKDLWLVSETSTPYHVGEGEDGRKLGVCLLSLTLDDGLGMRRTIELDDPALGTGFHAPEDGRRWTDGRAHLSPELWRDCKGCFFLRADVAAEAPRRWIAPSQTKGSAESDTGAVHVA